MNKKIKIKSSADIIKQKMRNNDEVIDYVNDILETIEQSIEDAIEREKKICIVKVSPSFCISFLSREQATKDIYFLTHQALIQAGYIVNIKYKGTTLYDSIETFFIIKWETNFDTVIDEHKNIYLEKISEKF